VVLTGGSAFGLAAVDGVMQGLVADGIGFAVGGPGEVVPIVPGAVIFDLGRGGIFACRPDAALGGEAYRAALTAAGGEAVAQGVIGAGTGASAGQLKGGIGTASAVLADGTTVAALLVVNPVGSTVDPDTGELYASRFGLDGEFPVLATPSEDEMRAARALVATLPGPAATSQPVLATTIGVIATDATLSKAQCAKVAGIGHDGMARAIRPVHTMFDGDTLFALATGARPAPGPVEMHALLGAAADCVTRAIGHAVLAAETVHTPVREWRSYRDTFPSAFPAVATVSDEGGPT
jgi:L-aminopeptidase/D-esterase-like protein